MFRPLFLRRYGHLMAGPAVRVLVKAGVVSLAHVSEQNWVALGLTFLGGAAFGYVYARRGWFLVVVLMPHARRTGAVHAGPGRVLLSRRRSRVVVRSLVMGRSASSGHATRAAVGSDRPSCGSFRLSNVVGSCPSWTPSGGRRMPRCAPASAEVEDVGASGGEPAGMRKAPVVRRRHLTGGRDPKRLFEALNGCVRAMQVPLLAPSDQHGTFQCFLRTSSNPSCKMEASAW